MPFTKLMGMGMAIGLLAAIPVGPVNVLVIAATLSGGRLRGLLTGLGALIADTLIAAVIAFGITQVIDFIESHEKAIQVIGGAVLIAFGLATMRRHPHLPGAAAAEAKRPALRMVFASFAMVITNPGALLGMIALFGMVGPLLEESLFAHPLLAAGTVVAGVALGGLLWWVFLTLLVERFKRRLTDLWLFRLNQAAGVLLMLAGATLLALEHAAFLEHVPEKLHDFSDRNVR